MTRFQVLTPSAMKNLIAFQNLRRNYQVFARIQGINPTTGSSSASKRICVAYQFLLHFHSLLGLCFLAYEFSNKRVEFLGGIECLIIILGTVCNASCGLFLFINQHKLKDLFDFCERLSTNTHFNETLLLRIAKTIQILAAIVPTTCAIGTALVSLYLKKGLLPIPIYYPAFLAENTGFYVFLFTYQVIFNVIFWLFYSIFLSTYVILVEHVSGKYIILCNMLEELHENRVQSLTIIQINNKITQIGKEHAELLWIIRQANSIFEIPLFCNQVFAIMSITMTFTIMIYEHKDVVFAIQGIVVFSGCLLYPFLGERISKNAEKFLDVVYECEWLILSPSQRKAISLIIMMAQKSVGFSTGGFHFSNYMEITQVSLLVQARHNALVSYLPVCAKNFINFRF